MNIWLLIDGYNLIGPVAAPGSRRSGGSSNWLRVERQRLIDRLVEHLPATLLPHTCVVFDAKQSPTDRAGQLSDREIVIRFATDHDEADDLLEELIAAHTSPKQLMVVSSDHRVQAAARRKKAKCYDSDLWVDRLLEGRPPLNKVPTAAKPREIQSPLSKKLPELPSLDDLPDDETLRRLMGH